MFLGCAGVLYVLLYVVIAKGYVPFFFASSENYNYYLESNNLASYDPRETSFLSDTSLHDNPGRAPGVYTHNPNSHRLLGALLVRAGIHNIHQHVLIVCTIAIALFLHALRATFSARPYVAPLLLALFVLDFYSFHWMSNMYRVWHYPLFFYSLLAVSGRASLLVSFVVFFLLFQYDLTFAAFTAIAAASTALLAAADRGTVRRLSVCALGALASVGVFVTQLVTFYGVAGLVKDLTTTYRQRQSINVPAAYVATGELLQFFGERPPVETLYRGPVDFLDLLRQAAVSTYAAYGPLPSAMAAVGLATAAGVVAAGLAGRRARPPTALADLSRIVLACLGAFALIGLANRGFTHKIYVYFMFPMANFLVIGTFAVFVVALARGVGHVGRDAPRWTAIGCALAVVMVAAPLGAQAIQNYARHPLMNGAGFYALEKRVPHGERVATALPWPYSIAVWGVTGSPAIEGVETMAPAEAARVGYPRYWFCVDWKGFGHDCRRSAAAITVEGHEVIEEGDSFVIVRLDWSRPPRCEGRSAVPPLTSHPHEQRRVIGGTPEDEMPAGPRRAGGAGRAGSSAGHSSAPGAPPAPAPPGFHC